MKPYFYCDNRLTNTLVCGKLAGEVANHFWNGKNVMYEEYVNPNLS